MKELLTADQMRRSDQRMIRTMQVPSLVLMERAALQCVEAMKKEGVDLTSALIVCGSGNNGGDGFAIARMLLEEGYCPDVVLVGNYDHRSEETRMQMQILENLGLSVGNSLPQKEYSVIIDAVFGIGLSREIQGNYADVIEKMNQMGGYKVAVDTPSGVSSDDGRVLGVAFKADLTVTFAFGKIGQILYPGCAYTGKLVIAPIGITRPEFFQEEEICRMFEKADVPEILPERKADSNKGSYGKVLMITGSKGMSGAAYLSARAAYLTGAGLVRIYTEESNRAILQELLPEAVLTTYSLEEENSFEKLPELLAWADVVCIGCGLGMEPHSEELLKKVLEMNTKPGVIDADGLNLLAKTGAWGIEQVRKNSSGYVLTPHMKEMSRLTGYSVQELKDNRRELLRNYTEKVHAVCVLKDSRTLTAAPDKELWINASGNAAMAKAGSGDVLAGMITGLMAQHMEAAYAAVLGVYLHGLSGDHAREELGSYSVLAGDLLKMISRTLAELEDRTR